MKEVSEFQPRLKKLLEYHYKDYPEVKVYQGTEIKNVIKKKWRKVPDLILIHPFNFFNNSYKKPVLKSPIGIEVKSNDKIAAIAGGLVDQLRDKYAYEEYLVDGEQIKTNSSLFTAPQFIKEGKYRDDPHILWTVKRFAWAFDVGLILKDIKTPNLMISYHNFIYTLDGRSICMDGGHGEKYDLIWDSNRRVIGWI